MVEKLKLQPLTIEVINKLGKDVRIECLERLLESKDALKKLGLKQGIVYNYDSLEFGDIDDLSLCEDNIMEARYFNNKMELNLYRSEEGLKGILVIDRGEENFVVEDRFIYYKKGVSDKKYRKILVKNYIDFDEDNQAYFYYTKPCSFLKEE